MYCKIFVLQEELVAYQDKKRKLQVKLPPLLKKRDKAVKQKGHNASNYFVPGPLFNTKDFKEIMGIDYEDYLSYTSDYCDLADFSSDDESRLVSSTLFLVHFSVHLLFNLVTSHLVLVKIR